MDSKRLLKREAEMVLCPPQCNLKPTCLSAYAMAGAACQWQLLPIDLKQPPPPSATKNLIT
jgi:hypothetical protein